MHWNAVYSAGSAIPWAQQRDVGRNENVLGHWLSSIWDWADPTITLGKLDKEREGLSAPRRVLGTWKTGWVLTHRNYQHCHLVQPSHFTDEETEAQRREAESPVMELIWQRRTPEFLRCWEGRVAGGAGLASHTGWGP